MDDLTEIRWHGRGGQGVVTAAKLLAEVALSQGRYFQAFPEYGPERMGAPIQAFTRIGVHPISIYCSIENPGVVVVLDSSLLSSVGVSKGLTGDGVIIVNSSKEPAELKEFFTGLRDDQLYTVDATRIATDSLGRAIPNIPMIGALLKVTDLMPIDSVAEHVKKAFSKKFPEPIVEGNVKALKLAYEEVK